MDALARRGLGEGLRVFGSAKVADAIPLLTNPVQDGDRLRLGNSEGSVMLTEGHIDGHISYLFGDLLFCGDTMFGAGCGYLFDGPPEAMHRSLQRLAALPAETHVCCAHEYTEDNLLFALSVEPQNLSLTKRIAEVKKIRSQGGCSVPSTIGEERKTNPFLRYESPELLGNLKQAWPGRDLSSPALIFAATRALKDRKDYKKKS